MVFPTADLFSTWQGDVSWQRTLSQRQTDPELRSAIKEDPLAAITSHRSLRGVEQGYAIGALG